jgi:HAD superfamily hydrolase (TIGR01549 family)
LTRQAPVGHEPDFVLATHRALLDLGFPSVNHEISAAIFEALRIRISESRTLFSDVLPTLAELQRRGFLLGVVTNRQYGGQVFLDDLRKLGLLEYFAPEHISISGDLSIRKPNPAIFLNTLDALHIALNEAVMVGDNLYADVGGAQSLNIFAVWKPKMALRARACAQAAGSDEAQPRNGASTTETTKPVLDNDYLLDFVHQHDTKYYQHTYHKPQPDLIIEHISDLLAVFPKAGKQ